MTEYPLIIIGFSSHRLEVLPYEQKEMRRSDAIVLEEAPAPGFLDVLAKQSDLEAYMENQDKEFPAFSRRQIEQLQGLYQIRKTVYQIEPYLERVIEIHELLAQGASPREVMDRPRLRTVYETEKLADGLLLKFYASSFTAPFSRVVAAVREFARADAARLRLRDTLRAEAIVPLVESFSRIYVEAGYIHLFLVKALRGRLFGKARLRPVFLMAPLVLPELGVPQPLGPGDLLTLSHIFQSDVSVESEELLAARSLIYIQLLQKTEMAPDSILTPHLADEVNAHRLIMQLSWNDCAALYPEIKHAAPEKALHEVQRHLADKAP